MKSHNELCAELQGLVTGSNSSDLLSYLQDNMVSLFASPHISQYYQLIRRVDVSSKCPPLPRLIVAWLAFLCGDNVAMNTAMRQDIESQLNSPEERSFYYSLIALSGLCASPDDRLHYGKLAVEILPQQQQTTLYMANARLTYGQIQAGFDRYREAAELFADAYRMFHELGMLFPAAIALTNELLNRYRLGQFFNVIEKGNHALTMAASFHSARQDYWDIIYLPLGMCHFELNKPTLAIGNLNLAKQAIDQMELFHMHGLIEYYLFKSHLALGEYAHLHSIVSQAEGELGSMQGSDAELLVCVLRVLLGLNAGEDRDLKPDIERLEVAYMVHKSRPNWFLVEALACLRIRNFTDALAIDDLIQCLKKFRYSGMIPFVQLLLLFLSELNYQQDKANEARSCLKEAAALVKEYGVCVHFFVYPLECLTLLKNIDAPLYKALVSKGRIKELVAQQSLLSAREREILELIALGKNNEELGALLFISVGTVKWHINHILSKLEVRNRIEAVNKGKSLGEIR